MLHSNFVESTKTSVAIKRTKGEIENYFVQVVVHSPK